MPDRASHRSHVVVAAHHMGAQTDIERRMVAIGAGAVKVPKLRFAIGSSLQGALITSPFARLILVTQRVGIN